MELTSSGLAEYMSHKLRSTQYILYLYPLDLGRQFTHSAKI
jgi:hypothetical protein